MMLTLVSRPLCEPILVLHHNVLSQELLEWVLHRLEHKTFLNCVSIIITLGDNEQIA